MNQYIRQYYRHMPIDNGNPMNCLDEPFEALHYKFQGWSVNENAWKPDEGLEVIDDATNPNFNKVVVPDGFSDSMKLFAVWDLPGIVMEQNRNVFVMQESNGYLIQEDNKSWQF